MTRKLMGHISRSRGGILCDTSGTTALEFALVAPLFLLILFGIFAFGLVLFMRGALDNGTSQAVRMIRLGNPSKFPTILCDEVGTLLNCNGLRYYVQAGSSFGALSAAITTDASGNLGTSSGASATAYPTVPSGTGTSSGAANPSPFIIVQVGYMVNLPSGWVAELAGLPGGVLLVSTVAFENEPY